MSSAHPVPVADSRPLWFLERAYLTNSISVPYEEILNDDTTVCSAEQVSEFCTSQGLDLSKDLMISCEIGFSATVLQLALQKATGKDFPVHDGSLTELKKRAPELVTWGTEQPPQ